MPTRRYNGTRIRTRYRYAKGSRSNNPFIGVVLIVVGLMYGAAQMTVPFAERGSHGTNSTNSTNSTVPFLPANLTEHETRNPECNDSNWSAGSAFFTIIAICFGYYSHPRGSLVTARSGRTWRLSPVLAAQDTVFILGLFVYSRIQGKRSVAICYAILASRLLSGFHPAEHNELLGLTIDAPPPDDDLETYRLTREAEANTANSSVPDTERVDIEAQQPALQVVVENQNDPAANIEGGEPAARVIQESDEDLEMQELPPNDPAAQEPAGASQAELSLLMPDWHSETWQANYQTSRAIVAQRRLDYNVHLFKKLFHYIDTLDAGPSYRVFVWLPMLLQAGKLLAVFCLSERVSRMAFSIAATYFVSWIAVELVMLTVAQNELEEAEIEEAAHLGREWRELLSEWSGEGKFPKEKNPTAFTAPSMWIVTVVNVVFAGKFVFDAGLPYIPNMFLAIVVFTCICTGTIVVFSGCCMVPTALLLLYALFKMFWKLSRAENFFGKSRVLREDVDFVSLFPASAGVCSAALVFLAFLQVGPWKDSFPCWTMTTPWFYDWMG